MVGSSSSAENSVPAHRRKDSPVAPRPESRSAPDKKSESAHGPANHPGRRGRQPVLATETFAPPHENPACSEKNPRRSRPQLSRAENRGPLPASACRQECPARHLQTRPASPDIAASCAPCLDPAVRSEHPQIRSANALRDAPNLLQKSKHTSSHILGRSLARLRRTHSNGTQAGCDFCDRSSKYCNSCTRPMHRNSGTAPTRNIPAG